MRKENIVKGLLSVTWVLINYQLIFKHLIGPVTEEEGRRFTENG